LVFALARPAGQRRAVAVWPRDRLGSLRPFDPDRSPGDFLPIQAGSDHARVFINIGGSGRIAASRSGCSTKAFIRSRVSAAPTRPSCHDGFRVPVS